MLVALYVLTYILIGWIVASVCLTISMRNNGKHNIELLWDFVLPFIFWPAVIIAFVFILKFKIIMYLGRITEKVISKLMERKDDRNKIEAVKK